MSFTVVDTFTFRAISNEEEGFLLEIKLQSDQTFFEFHEAILNSLGYDKSQLTSFYITNKDWEKQEEITLIDMSEGTAVDFLKMEDTLLKDRLKDERSRLLYVFDFFFERALNMELIQIKKEDLQQNLPVVLKLEGTIPPQAQMPDNMDEGLGDYSGDHPDEDIQFESLDDLDL